MGLQRHGDTDDPEEEAEELLAMEEELAATAEAELAALAESADAASAATAAAEEKFEDVPAEDLKDD